MRQARAATREGAVPLMTMEIKLTQGFVTLVDDEDYEQLQAWKWYAQVLPSGRVYAQRRVCTPGPRKAIAITLAAQVLWIPVGSPLIVDHINHDGLDNQRSNLRLCNQSQNQGNRRKQQGTSSPYKGVYREKGRGKWRALIYLNDSKRHLGCFTDEIEAAKAYDEAALAQWGDFACLNFPPTSYARMVAE